MAGSTGSATSGGNLSDLKEKTDPFGGEGAKIGNLWEE